MSRIFTPTKRIGRINSLEDGRFQWTIHNFRSQVLNGIFENSPDFHFLDSSYNVRLVLFGTQMYIILEKSHESPLQRLLVELRMGTGSTSISQTQTGETDKQGNFLAVMSMPYSELDSRRLEILHEGRFTLLCNLRSLDAEEIVPAWRERLPGTDEVAGEMEPSESDSDADESIIEWKIIEKMQEDFKNLLTSGEDSDVTVKVQGKEFPAHRGILRSRSPVFKSMFSHDMVEKESGVVVIDDCDPATFPDFLNYVYTGSTKHICDENACRLYTVSDKYGVEELKQKCAAFMEGNLSVGTFCDVITLALRHAEQGLVDFATGFFCANAREIVKTAKWQVFLQENLTVGNELFIKALSGGNNI